MTEMHLHENTDQDNSSQKFRNCKLCRVHVVPIIEIAFEKITPSIKRKT